MFTKAPTLQDIRVQLKEIEREQNRKRRELRLKENEKSEKIQDSVKSSRVPGIPDIGRGYGRRGFQK